MIRYGIFNWFAKITGWLPQFVCFRTKIYYEDPAVQKRHIKGPAIVISNHTSVYDFAVFLFVFFTRTLRYQMAEVLFRKQPLGTLMRLFGGIYVDRDTHNFGFIAESEDILRKGGVVGIFPEARLPLKGEERPLPFKTSAAYLALSSGVPVIPVFTNGSYFCPKRARVIIGKPIDVSVFCTDGSTDKENIEAVSEGMRGRIIELERLLYEKTGA
jgi:1-acyl-sn-glycerol-3-phosphate acyltransferase